MKGEKEMEEKKPIQVSLGAVISIFIIILLTVALVGMYYYYNFVVIPKYETANNKETENVLENSQINNEETDNTESEKNIKIDSSKELVYNAEYTYKDLDGKSYKSVSTEKTYSLKDIQVPYININSEDAKKANNDIKEIFDGLAKFFEEELKDTKTWYNISKYEYFINDKVLSIVITVESGGTDVKKYEYYTFNFDLNTLKSLNYEEMYKNAGFTSDNINSKVENEIKNCDLLKELTEEHVGEFETVEQYINNSINNYKLDVFDNEIKYYLNDSGKLNVIVDVEAPVGRGVFQTILTID